MVFKKIFGGGNQQPAEHELTIDDLIVLERYEEAQARLEAKVKVSPKDLHSHLRLADVLIARGKLTKALDEYLLVADLHTEDGFYDKAIALLTKAVRLAPTEVSLQQKIARIQRLKTLEHSRSHFIDGVAQREAETSPLNRRSLVELQMIWQRLAGSRFIQSLPPDLLRKLAASLDLVQFKSEEKLATRGAADSKLFLIVDGLVEAVLERPSAGFTSIRSFSSGDILGESCLLEQKPWPCTLMAREPSRAFVLDRPGLERALGGNPDPRGFVEALRAQRNDLDLAGAVRRLLSGAS